MPGLDDLHSWSVRFQKKPIRICAAPLAFRIHRLRRFRIEKDNPFKFEAGGNDFASVVNCRKSTITTKPSIIHSCAILFLGSSILTYLHGFIRMEIFGDLFLIPVWFCFSLKAHLQSSIFSARLYRKKGWTIMRSLYKLICSLLLIDVLAKFMYVSYTIYE